MGDADKCGLYWRIIISSDGIFLAHTIVRWQFNICPYSKFSCVWHDILYNVWYFNNSLGRISCWTSLFISLVPFIFIVIKRYCTHWSFTALLIYHTLKHNNVKQLKHEKSANCNMIMEQFCLDLYEYYSVIFNKVLYFDCTSKTHRISLVYWNCFKCRFPSDTEFRWISS